MMDAWFARLPRTEMLTTRLSSRWFIARLLESDGIKNARGLSFRRRVAREYAQDAAVILYFRVREAPNVVVATASLVIYGLTYAYNRRRLGSSHKGPFLSPLGSCDTSQVSAATRQTLTIGIRLTVRPDDFALRNERTTHEAKESSEKQGLHCVHSASNWSANGMWNVRLRGNAADGARFSMLLTFAFAVHSSVFTDLSIKPLREIITV